jgi:hypothetical protein
MAEVPRGARLIRLSFMLDEPAVSPKRSESPLVGELIKNVATLIAIFVGLVYAMGWLSSHIVVLSLGVGPLAISKENAVVAGLAWLFAFAPLPLTVIYRRLMMLEGKDKKDSKPPLMTKLWILGIPYAILASCIRPMPDLFGYAPVLAGATFMMAFQWLVGYLSKDYFAVKDQIDGVDPEVSNRFKSLRLTQATLLFAVPFVVILHVSIFAMTVLASMRPGFGGLYQTNLAVRFVEGEYYERYQLMACDDTDAIFRPGWDFGQQASGQVRANLRGGDKWLPLIRIPWSRIEEMQEVRLDRDAPIWRPVVAPRVPKNQEKFDFRIFK